MEQYSCEFLKPDDFYHLKSSWVKLQRGIDMTFFQSFKWFEMLISKNDKRFYKRKVYFGIIKDASNHIVLIAPLFIKLSFLPLEYRKGVYFWGMGGFSDYSNFIYDNINDNIFEILFDSIVKTFKINIFYFDYLKEDTKLYRYIKNHTLIQYDYTSNCIGVSIPSDKDEYIRALSKNARQNIRTAKNRLAKDHVNIRVNFDDTNVNIDDFERYRNQRVRQKEKMDYTWFSFKRYLLSILDDRRIQIKPYYPYKDLKSSKFLTVTDVDNNRLMSAVNYGYSEHRKEIVAMCVCLNEDYKRYSPGIIGWYQFINSSIGDKNLNYIDFTRGNENYKFVLGGKPHHFHFTKFFIP